MPRWPLLSHLPLTLRGVDFRWDTIRFTADEVYLEPDLRPLLGKRLRLDVLKLRGAMLDIPSLEAATIEALVAAAHRHGLRVVAHVSTARGAATVAHCGVDVLAHAPFDRMTDAEVRDVARASGAEWIMEG